MSLPNHKEHIAIDADSELITAVAVTPGNVADSQMVSPLIAPHAQEVTADKGYDTNANHHKLKQRGQRSRIIVKKNRTNIEILGQANTDTRRERRHIERKFAEQGTPLKLCPSCEGGKKYHGLGKVRYWGRAKVTIQVLLTCIAVRQAHRPEQSRRVVNCKKIVKLLSAGLCPSSTKPCRAAG